MNPSLQPVSGPRLSTSRSPSIAGSRTADSFTGRALLWGAWMSPAILTVPHAAGLVQIIAAVAVAAGLAGVVAFLPRLLWKAACWLTLAAIPFTLWWCGAAAIGGAGPGYDQAVAALETNSGEALGALRFVLQSPSFDLAAILHLLLVSLALRAVLRPRPAAGGESAAQRRVHLCLLASLLPLWLCAWLAMDPAGFMYRTSPLFGVATLASPLGSAVEMAAMRVRILQLHREMGYRRARAPATMAVTTPILAIFIIGESARADGYGPNLRGRGAASRQLAERVDAGLGSWLPVTCASSDGTALSVPMLLTATPPARRDQAPSLPTFLGILKADGFRTAWLANNDAGPDARETGHDLYAGAFVVNPDSLRPASFEVSKYDDNLIEPARRFAGAVSRPEAMILHTIGSHFPYEWRYPPTFFPPEPAGLSSDDLKDLRYDRSLEYGAHVILQVATILDHSAAPAFLVYTSDHGENLPRDHNGLWAHLGPRTSTEDGFVPSFVLWNKAMAQTGRPARLLAKLVSAQQIAHADVTRLFLALAGITGEPVEPTPDPTIWGRVSVGDAYGVIRCSALKP